MRAQFNEFFRLPQENGAAPVAPPAPGPTGLHLPPQPQHQHQHQHQNHQPAPAATHGQTLPEPTGTPSTVTEPGSAASMSTVLTSSFAHLYPANGQTQTQSNEDAEIQRSIWGGPIQPGRFHAAPLGALPRYTSQINGTGAAGPSVGRAGPGLAVAVGGAAGPSIRRQPPSRVSISVPDPIASNQADGESLNSGIPTWANHRNSNMNLNAMASEVSTPFSSNPPEVFRSLSRSPDPTSRALEPDETSQAQEAGSKDDENEGASSEVQTGPETRNRRLAAEAAMRRLGITPSPTLSKGKEKEKEKEKVVEPPAIATEAVPRSTTAGQEKWKPFLSIPDRGPPHPPQPSHPTARPGLGPRNGNGTDYASRMNGMGIGREGVEGVDDRLRALREVDDGIWKMIEDLTRLKSQWDHVDADGNANGADGGVGADRGVGGVGMVTGQVGDGERGLSEGA